MPSARVEELVEVDRLTFHGFVRRAYRAGLRYQHLLADESANVRVRASLRQLAHLLLGLCKLVLGVPRRRVALSVAGVKECAFALGALAGLARTITVGAHKATST